MRRDYVPDGQRWASYGPLGYSFRHPTRESAEHAQVRGYVTNPDLHDRLTAMDRAEREPKRPAAWRGEATFRRAGGGGTATASR